MPAPEPQLRRGPGLDVLSFREGKDGRGRMSWSQCMRCGSVAPTYMRCAMIFMLMVGWQLLRHCSTRGLLSQQNHTLVHTTDKRKTYTHMHRERRRRVRHLSRTMSLLRLKQCLRACTALVALAATATASVSVTTERWRCASPVAVVRSHTVNSQKATLLTQTVLTRLGTAHGKSLPTAIAVRGGGDVKGDAPVNGTRLQIWRDRAVSAESQVAVAEALLVERSSELQFLEHKLSMLQSQQKSELAVARGEGPRKSSAGPVGGIFYASLYAMLQHCHGYGDAGASSFFGFLICYALHSLLGYRFGWTTKNVLMTIFILTIRFVKGPQPF